MNRKPLRKGSRPSPEKAANTSLARHAGLGLANCMIAACLTAIPAAAQITIDTKTGAVTNGSGDHSSMVDRRYAQIQPTHVPLTQSQLDAKTRLEIIRIMQAEQGFAMRPFPRGHKGLTLIANGKLIPAGEDYLSMVTAEGMSSKPGDRVVLTDVKIEHNKIVFQLNGGPDHKHAFLRHIQLGTGPDVMGPVVQTNDPEPMGSRLTLVFPKEIPELTGAQVKALLAPLISFDVKTPVQAFTDTLPAKLKEAILNHKVLVGMSTDMVLFAKGQPEAKSREMEGQMPFEEWIYGKPPKDVEFVRINGNRVIRVEIAKVGEAPVIFTKDEVEGLMRTDGTPLEAEAPNTRTVQMGDVDRNPDTQAPGAPPSLRKPGETTTVDQDIDKTQRVGVMKPVQFPKPSPDDQSGQAGQSGQPSDGTQAAAPKSGDGTQPKPANPPPANGAPPANVQTPPADASQPTPAKPTEAPGSTQPD
jgi:hypothetical protein